MSDLRASLEASLARGSYQRAEGQSTGTEGQVPLSLGASSGESAPPSWPEPGSTTYVTKPGGRHYKSAFFPEPLPGVTSVLKVLGLGTEKLID